MRIHLVPNIDNPRSCAAVRELVPALEGEGHVVTAAASDAAGCDLEMTAGAAADAELVVALGGDGTILKATHLLAGADVPIFGINLGRLGFLCGAPGDDPIGAVRAVIAGAAREERRAVLRAEATHGGRAAGAHHALNEIFVGRASGARAVDIAIEVDGEPLARWVCDGVIVATPTGSTAYALSAGGPVLAPELRALLVLPVNAHALAVRPLVLGPASRVVLTFPDAAREGACMVVDGDLVPCRSALERIEIALADEEVRTLRIDGRSFIGTARDSFYRG